MNTQKGPWGLFKHACGNQIAISCSKVFKTERFRHDSVMVSEVGEPFSRGENGPWGLFKHTCCQQVEAICSKVIKTERFRYDSVMVSDGRQFLEIAGDREAFQRDQKWTVGVA
jgi:hypothetical protein